MAQQKFAQFFRRYGIRERGHLSSPRLFPFGEFDFPFESAYHFRESNVRNGPSAQDQIFQGIMGRIFIEHVTTLSTREGNPRRTSVNVRTLEADFRRRSRGLRPLRRDEAFTINPRNLLVLNYAMLYPTHRYTVSWKSEYYRWYNVATTFWDKVQDVHERFRCNQFIEVPSLQTIPKFEDFLRVTRGLNTKSLEVFSEPGALDLVDLWQWFGEQREDSLLTKVKDPSLVNLIFRVRGHFAIMNLGLMDQWRKTPESELASMEGYQELQEELQEAVSLESTSGTIPPTQLQRMFLLLLRRLHAVDAGDATVEEPDEDVSEVRVEGSPKPTPPETEKEVEEELKRVETPEETTGTSTTSLPGLDDDGLVIKELQDSLEPPTTPPEEALTWSEGTRTPEPSEGPLEAPEPTTGALDYSAKLKEYAEEQLRLGSITKGTYERILREATAYQELPNPYTGEGRLGDALEITSEELALEQGETYPDSDTIVDKSMLSSTVRAMTTQYVQKTLKKDVMNAVLAATQNQGVVVKKYHVEEVQDNMNHFEVHTVTLKPVRGKQSTVRFRLPVVDDEGRFVVNSSTSKLRYQRSDLPIRKVSPSRVALTSYYNKTFVDRSSRATNNFGQWVCRQITQIGLDDSNDQITNLRLGNTFDQSLEVPRVYSILSGRFTQFQVANLQFYFEYHKREEYFSSVGISVTDAEAEGHTVIGYDLESKHPITVDVNDNFHLDGEVLGTLCQVVGLPEERAPIDIAEVTVSNKVLPVGLALAYQLGLDELIRLLECDVARHPRGTRLQLSPDEYSLVFQDETLVFSRLDRRASLVLAGLNRYHRVLRQHSVWDFQRKDVYHQVLLDQGLNIRYLRELDTLFAVWVDPITHGLLEEMGEPTTFQGLLLRATDLLLHDHAPNEVEGEFMRYRGYERMAGMVYGELARACKTYHARSHYGDAVVDINPHQVWQRIVGDPSTMIVEEANPFTVINEQEIMTYRGDGGRGGKSMVKRTRVFTESDMGVVSESTLDSGDVGVVAYLAPDANLTSTRGLSRRYSKDTDGAAKIFSSAALAAPCADRDDPKRVKLATTRLSGGTLIEELP